MFTFANILLNEFHLPRYFLACGEVVSRLASEVRGSGFESHLGILNVMSLETSYKFETSLCNNVSVTLTCGGSSTQNCTYFISSGTEVGQCR